MVMMLRYPKNSECGGGRPFSKDRKNPMLNLNEIISEILVLSLTDDTERRAHIKDHFVEQWPQITGLVMQSRTHQL